MAGLKGGGEEKGMSAGVASGRFEREEKYFITSLWEVLSAQVWPSSVPPGGLPGKELHACIICLLAENRNGHGEDLV